MLTREIARTVVDEVIARLGVRVNVMDAGGAILASSDPDRVDVVHPGAVEVIILTYPGSTSRP